MQASADLAAAPADATTIPVFTLAPENPSVIVPAGEYFLGDPCYTVPDEAWHRLLESCDSFDEATPVGIAMGFPVLAFSTAYGDGIYSGDDGHDYAVDAGLIGLVPASMPNQKRHEGMAWPPRRIKFSMPAHCWSCDGLLRFGHITIDTK